LGRKGVETLGLANGFVIGLESSALDIVGLRRWRTADYNSGNWDGWPLAIARDCRGGMQLGAGFLAAA